MSNIKLHFRTSLLIVRREENPTGPRRVDQEGQPAEKRSPWMTTTMMRKMKTKRRKMRMTMRRMTSKLIRKLELF